MKITNSIYSAMKKNTDNFEEVFEIQMTDTVSIKFSKSEMVVYKITTKKIKEIKNWKDMNVEEINNKIKELNWI
jgi:hypothetical protein